MDQPKHTPFLAERTYPQVQEFLKSGDAVVLPVGSLEPHGPHMPFGCDTYLGMATGVLAAQKESLLIAPPLFVTFAGSTRNLGAVAVSIRCETDYLMGYCEGLLEAGFRRIVMVSWHAPAYSAVEVARTLFEERLAPVALYNAMEAFEPAVLRPLFGKDVDGHYGEASALAAAFEILGLPQRVDFERTTSDQKEAPQAPGMDLISANKGLVGYYVTDLSQHIPTRANLSIEGGRKMIQHTADRVTGILRGLADYRDWLEQAAQDGTVKTPPPRWQR